MSARSRHHTLMLIACFAAVYVLWGSTYVGMKVAVQRIPPMLLGGGRFLFAGLCLMTIVAMFGGLQRRWLEVDVVREMHLPPCVHLLGAMHATCAAVDGTAGGSPR